MARGYPGIIYPIPNFPHTQVDVERMSRESVRRYLRHRLRAIEAQIRVLSREQDNRDRDWAWNPATLGAVWDTIIEIDYLQSMRDAITDTLAAL